MLCAESIVGDEPFAVILADDLIDAEQSVIGQLVEARKARGGGNVLAVEDVPREDTDKYGIVSSEPIDSRTSRMSHIVEKPAPDQAPSTLAVVGRYVLEPEIFDHLRSIPRGAGGEVQLTDAIARMVPSDQTFAYRYQGRRFDCGIEGGVRDRDGALCPQDRLRRLARSVEFIVVVACTRPQSIEPERHEEQREVRCAYQQKRPEDPPVRNAELP